MNHVKVIGRNILDTTASASRDISNPVFARFASKKISLMIYNSDEILIGARFLSILSAKANPKKVSASKMREEENEDKWGKQNQISTSEISIFFARNEIKRKSGKIKKIRETIV